MASAASPMGPVAVDAMEWSTRPLSAGELATTKAAFSVYIDRREKAPEDVLVWPAELCKDRASTLQHSRASRQPTTQPLHVVGPASPSTMATASGKLTQLPDRNGTREARYTIQCPLAEPNDPRTIDISATIVAPLHATITPHSLPNKKWLVYLCGGPGADNPTADRVHISNYFHALGYWVLFPDYRGTGHSTAIDADNLKSMANATGETPADFLALLRQDHIVRDLECMRRSLGSTERWELLGQSYGGWIIMTYLSFHPGGVDRAFISAGVPPVGKTPAEVHVELYNTLQRRNEAYYATYPDDKEVIRRIVGFIQRNGGLLSHKTAQHSRMTAKRFLGIGRTLGHEHGAEKVHKLVTDTIGAIGREEDIPDELLKELAKQFKHDERPLYGALLDSIYCDGPVAGNWAGDEGARGRPGFGWVYDDWGRDERVDGALYFGGEMAFRHIYEDYDKIRGMGKVVEELQKKDDWSRLYDLDALETCKVPLTAIMYEDDMYLPIKSSQDVARRLAGNENFTFITDPHLAHGAIKDARTGGVVLDALIRGEAIDVSKLE